jgi:hypothetical protein
MIGVRTGLQSRLQLAARNRQGETAFEVFPSGDQRIVEGFAHASEALAGVDAQVDLLDSRTCSPSGPSSSPGSL